MTTFKINGKVVSREEWYNSTEDGIHQAYYTNGQLRCEDNYQNNKRHGLQRDWYGNGQVAYEEIWVNGIERTEEFKDNKLAQIVVFGRVIL